MEAVDAVLSVTLDTTKINHKNKSLEHF